MKFWLEEWFSSLRDSRRPHSCGEVTAAAITFYQATFPVDVRDAVKHGASVLFVFADVREAGDSEFFKWDMRVAAMQNNAFVLARTSDALDRYQEFIAANPLGEPIAISMGDKGDHFIELAPDLIQESRRRWPFLALLQTS